MSGRPDTRGKLLSITLVWVFLFINLFVMNADLWAEPGMKFENEGFSQSEHAFYIDSDSSSFHKDVAAEPRVNVVSMRRIKEDILKISVVIHLFFSVWLSFSLWSYLRRAFFACLLSSHYPSSRFLDELLIQWKKDGKKGRRIREKTNLEY
ncbi:MAG: hypothetical protein ACOX8E_01495 [Ruminococcus sp.]|jgi:hypothetical protein